MAVFYFWDFFGIKLQRKNRLIVRHLGWDCVLACRDNLLQTVRGFRQSPDSYRGPSELNDQ